MGRLAKGSVAKSILDPISELSFQITINLMPQGILTFSKVEDEQLLIVANRSQRPSRPPTLGNGDGRMQGRVRNNAPFILRFSS